MNIRDLLATLAAPPAPRAQARPQAAPTRTLADFLRAHVVKADTVAKRKAILLARYGKGEKR